MLITNEADLIKSIEIKCFEFYEQENTYGASKVYERVYEKEFEGDNTIYSYNEFISIKNGKVNAYQCSETRQSSKLLQQIKSNTIFYDELLTEKDAYIYILKDQKYKFEMYNIEDSKIGYAYRFKLVPVTAADIARLNKAKLNDSFLQSKQEVSRLQYRYIDVDSYSKSTEITLYAGDRINMEAWGEISFGTFAGSGGPNGITGFSSYNIVPGFNHGSLLYRIGSGNWSAVGESKTFVADISGKLQMMVNDNDPSNNTGNFSIVLKIISAK